MGEENVSKHGQVKEIEKKGGGLDTYVDSCQQEHHSTQCWERNFRTLLAIHLLPLVVRDHDDGETLLYVCVCLV